MSHHRPRDCDDGSNPPPECEVEPEPPIDGQCDIEPLPEECEEPQPPIDPVDPVDPGIIDVPDEDEDEDEDTGGGEGGGRRSPMKSLTAILTGL